MQQAGGAAQEAVRIPEDYSGFLMIPEGFLRIPKDS